MSRAKNVALWMVLIALCICTLVGCVTILKSAYSGVMGKYLPSLIGIQ